MSDGTLSPPLLPQRFGRYPEYRDTGIEWLGEIPAHWEVAALHHRYEQALGKMLDAKRITGDHLVPYLRNVDVQWGRINCIDLPEMDILPHEIRRYTVRSGDLLVCEGGEAGRCAIWQGDLSPCGYQKALHRLRPFDGQREWPRFLYYVLCAAATRDAFVDGQGSTFAHLTGNMLRAHRFPFPRPAEQRAIADHLDRETAKIEAVVAKQQELIRLLQEKRSALISQTVTKGLNPDVPTRDSGVEWLGEIPAHWRMVALKRVAPSQAADVTTERPGDLVWQLDLEHIAADTGRVLTKQLAPVDEMSSSTVRFDESKVLYSKLRPYLNKVVVPDETGVATSELIPLSPHPDIAIRFFLAAYLRSRGFVAFASRHTSGTKMPRIIPASFWSHAVPIPPTVEQTAIVRYLDRETAKIDALVAKITESIKLLREYRTALISTAVTGQIDVRSAHQTNPTPSPADPEPIP